MTLRPSRPAHFTPDPLPLGRWPVTFLGSPRARTTMGAPA